MIRFERILLVHLLWHNAASKQHYLRNRERQFSLKCNVVTADKNLPEHPKTHDLRSKKRWLLMHHWQQQIIINTTSPHYHQSLSLERQKYLSMLNREINAFLSL